LQSDYATLISEVEKYKVPPQQVVSIVVAFVMREKPLRVVGAALLSARMAGVVRLGWPE
jgi:hypothetical protein